MVSFFTLFSCTNEITTQNPRHNFDSLLVESFTIDFSDRDLSYTSVSSISLVGAFDHYYAFHNWRTGIIYHYDRNKKAIVKEFKISHPISPVDIYMVSVLSKDSVIYLDEEIEAIRIVNQDTIIGTYPLSHLDAIHSEMTAVHMKKNFKFIDGSFLIKNWANYDNVGISDSLMDTRDMFGLVTFDGKSNTSYKPIPIQSFYKRSNKKKKVYDITPDALYNSKENRVDVYYMIGDTVKSYYLESGEVKKYIVHNSEYQIKPVMLPKPATAADYKKLMEDFTGCQMYYSDKYDLYVRKVIRDTLSENGLVKRSYYLEVLSPTFESLAIKSLNDRQSKIIKVGNEVFIGEVDKRNKQITYSRFTINSITI